jgi:MYXO-CTERM domain-containing protein
MSARSALALALLAVLLAPAAAWSYSLRTNSAGEVLVWQQRRQQVEVDASLVPHLPGAADAVRAAFATWVDAGMPMKLHLKPAADKAVLAYDGRNVVTWEAAGWKYTKEVVAMTVSLHKAKAATLTEADIVLNGHDSWTTSPAPGDAAFDIQNVLTHEVGHFLGMGHEPAIPEATMYPYTPAGETSKRQLHPDDVAGVSALAAEMEQRVPDDDGKADALGEDPLATGCSVGSGAGGTWLVLLPLLAGIIRRRRRWPGALLLVALATAATPARASVVRELTIPQLASSADVVVQARVIGQRTSLEDGLVVTDHYLVVLRSYRGDRVAALTLRTLGGQLGDLVMDVAGSPRLAIGDTVVAFGRWQGNALVPIGLSLGLFRLTGGRAVRDASGLHLWQDGRLRNGGIQTVPLDRLERSILDAARVGHDSSTK